MHTTQKYPFRDIEAKWRQVMTEQRATAAQPAGEPSRPEADPPGGPEGAAPREPSAPDQPAPAGSPATRSEAPSPSIFVWPAAAGALTRADPASDDGRSLEDWGLLRRLVAGDTQARFQRHQPDGARLAIGIDGFDPRASDAARAGRTRPDRVVERDRIRLQELAERLGLQLEGPIVSTSDPAYYAVTQWLFLQLQARGLVRWAVRACDECVRCGQRFRLGIHGVCPGCQGELERRQLRERRVDVSPYGDRLLGDLDTGEKRGRDRREGGRRDGSRRHRKGGGPRKEGCDDDSRETSDGAGSEGAGPEGAGTSGRPDPTGRRPVWSRRDSRLQRATLGRVRGCEIVFPVSRAFELEFHDLTVFTTRVEMLYGVTFLLVEPHHPILEHVLDLAYEEEVVRYRERLKRGSEPRISAVRTGGFALNPLSFKKIPILVSALACVRHHGGAALGVPGHDADHFELARRLQLPIREVVHNDKARFDHQSRLEEPWLGDGLLTNSGPFCGLPRKVARERIITALGRKGCCQKATRFRFWSYPISESSEWGPPVPVVRCEECGEVPVPETELPLTRERRRRGARCPICDAAAQWDPETLHPWLGDAWSFLRLALPHLDEGVEGFRPPAGPGGAPAEGPPTVGTQGPEEAGASAAESSPADLEPAGPQAEGGDDAGANEGSPVSPEPEVLPEDVDIFGTPPDRPREGEDSGAEEPGDVQEPDGSPATGADGEPKASTPDDAPPRGAGVDEGRPGDAPDSMDAEETTEGTARGRQPRRGARPTAAAEPPSRREIADDDDDARPERSPWQPSSLRPFASPALRRIPVAVAFCDARTPIREIITLRFLTKVLHDLGHVPSHLPFSRCIRVEPVVATLPRPKDGPPQPSGGAGGRSDPIPEGARQPGLGTPREGQNGEAADVLAAIDEFGADAVRLQILACGPLDRRAAIDRDRLSHARRFLDRIWSQVTSRIEQGKFISRRMLVAKHRLIDEITRRVASGKPHTAVAALMRFVRFLESPETAPEEMDRNAIQTFLILLSPFAPFLARELWSRLETSEALDRVPWPQPNEELIHPPEQEFPVFVDGRLRDRMVQPSDLEPEKLESRALQRDAIRERIGNRRVRKVIAVPRKLVSIVLEPEAG